MSTEGDFEEFGVEMSLAHGKPAAWRALPADQIEPPINADKLH
jgi:hypothetical protein